MPPILLLTTAHCRMTAKLRLLTVSFDTPIHIWELPVFRGAVAKKPRYERASLPFTLHLMQKNIAAARVLVRSKRAVTLSSAQDFSHQFYSNTSEA